VIGIDETYVTPGPIAAASARACASDVGSALSALPPPRRVNALS